MNGKVELNYGHEEKFKDECRVNISGEVRGIKFAYQVVVTHEGIIVDAVDTKYGDVLDPIAHEMHTEFFSDEPDVVGCPICGEEFEAGEEADQHIAESSGTWCPGLEDDDDE